MGVDGPSLGGFSKIATVCSVDFGVLAQTRPGQQVRFSAIGWEDAVHLAASWSQRIDQEENVIQA
jgi:allophanate hydrolase subunit 2